MYAILNQICYQNNKEYQQLGMQHVRLKEQLINLQGTYMEIEFDYSY